MRYNLYLLQYNNYYNRVVKKLNTLEAYQDYLVAKIMDLNIDIKDSINTTIVINYKEQLDTPNYLLIEDKGRNVVTRWFVIECTMIRGLQYSLAIRRDVIADYFDEIMVSPCIVQKGWVSNNNVLVFNKEQQEYNKVKTNELPIKDNTGIGYVVGFVARDSNHSGKIKTSYNAELQIDFDYSALSTATKEKMAIGSATPQSYFTDRKIAFIDVNNVGDSIYWYIGPNQKLYFVNNNSKIRIYNDSYSNSDFNVSTSSNFPTLSEHIRIYGQQLATSVITSNQIRDLYLKPFHKKLSSITLGKLNNYISKSNEDVWRSYLNITPSDYNYLKSFDGKICEISGVYYRAELKSSFKQSGNKTNDINTLTYYIRQSLPNSTDLLDIDMFVNKSINIEDLVTSDIQLYYDEYNVYIKLTPINEKVYTNLTDKANRTHLIDNPYDMFVIPYDNDYVYTVNNTDYQANKNMAINLAQAICEASGSETYDIQIVPFCPFNIESHDWSLINSEAIYRDVGGDNDDSNDDIVGYYFWTDKSNRTFSIGETRTALTLSDNPSYKEITQLHRYILCSPDKSSQWEFNPAMNKGITQWNVSFDYRPYSSYVKIQPKWDYLYGQEDYNGSTDYRGLIFNGAYSLTQLNDAWANYLNSNKNYQQIFDTQINTEIKKFSMNQEAQWNTVGLRNYSFNPIKSVLGIIGESKQMDFDREVFNVDLSAKRDLFNYQLDNIQNQPDTIKKLTSINIDFRIFPFIEIFEPQEQEVQLFQNMIRYNGMTIMCTGYIENYLEPNNETFIKATLIRFNEFEAQENDYTLVQNINIELDKGIYITKEE